MIVKCSSGLNLKLELAFPSIIRILCLVAMETNLNYWLKVMM